MEGLVLEQLSVVHIALCNEEVDDLPPFIDDDMKFEPKEPSHTALALFRYSLKNPVLLFSFGMTYLYQGGIHKGDSLTLVQTAHLQEQYHRDHGLLLQLHKTGIGYRMREILPHVFAYMIEVKVLKATVSFLMEKHHNGNHFALGHFRGPVASFYSRAIIDPVLVKNLVQSYAKIVDKAKNFRNFIGRNHKRIIG